MSRFDQEIHRPGTGSVKHDLRLQRFGTEDVEAMWVADMDFATPEPIVAALSRRLEHPVFGYTLRDRRADEAFVAWMELRHNYRIDPDWLVFGPGVVPSMVLALRAFTDPGDRVVVQTPVYPPFFDTVRDNGRELLVNPLSLEGGRYGMDLDDLARKLKQGVRMMMLCSPHNPVGRVWQATELQALIDLCEQYDTLVLADEIHADLLYAGVSHTPAGKLSSRLVTLTSPGKGFNIAGITPSVAVIPEPKLRAHMQRVTESSHLSYGNLLGNVAFTAAYLECGPWLDELMDYLSGSVALVEDFFRTKIPQISVIHPEATFLLWLDCRGLGMTDRVLNRFFIEQAKLGLNTGVSFGPGGEGFMRLNIAVPRRRLAAALERIHQAVVRL